MRRWLRRSFVLASVLLCLAMLALWGLTYYRSYGFDSFRREAGGGAYHETLGVFATRGSVGAGSVRLYLPSTQRWPGDPRWRFNTGPASVIPWSHRWRFLGFGYWDMTYPPTQAHRGVRPHGFCVPFWFLALLLGLMALPPTRREWREWRARRWLRRGLCAKCGYDLCANRERCPECGEPVATA